jgi:hypothetical protein
MENLLLLLLLLLRLRLRRRRRLLFLLLLLLLFQQVSTCAVYLCRFQEGPRRFLSLARSLARALSLPSLLPLSFFATTRSLSLARARPRALAHAFELFPSFSFSFSLSLSRSLSLSFCSTEALVSDFLSDSPFLSVSPSLLSSLPPPPHFPYHLPTPRSLREFKFQGFLYCVR